MSVNVEERRVQRLGTSSLIVTLPKKWVKKVNLKPGDKVAIVIEGDEIKILPPSSTPIKREKQVIKLRELENKVYLQQLPTCLYILGVRDAILNGHSLDITTINKIITQISGLSGTQATCLGNNKIEIKVFIDSEDVLPLLESIFRNLVLMLRTIRKALDREETITELVDDAKMLQKEIYKKYYLMLRLAHKNTGPTHRRHEISETLLSSELGLLSLLLGRLALETISTLASIGERDFSQATLEATDELIKAVDELGLILRKPDHAKLASIYDVISRVRNKLDTIIREGGKTDLFTASKIQDFLILLEEATSLVSCWQTITILLEDKVF
ncbi:MAG: AbrB/MazE/SpoVT family DNA-binding domain-containing protein [Desulfurococcales archaeon]|nr:AbrB/MazE/SpoVT family DNA-binding domain-containing protein [Desulfurococcales archaeon]